VEHSITCRTLRFRRTHELDGEAEFVSGPSIEFGEVTPTLQQIIPNDTDWRFLDQVKRE
jgi:hypothetical protein